MFLHLHKTTHPLGLFDIHGGFGECPVETGDPGPKRIVFFAIKIRDRWYGI